MLGFILPTTVLISRPMTDAEALKQAVLSMDSEAQVVLAPAIEIVPMAYDVLDERFDALILTSKHAAAAAAAIAPDARVFCVGDTTAQAAVDLGLKTTSAAGNAQTLIDLVRKSEVSKALYLRGAHVHTDLETELNSAGIETKSTIVYRQSDCVFSPQILHDIAQAPTLLVPVYSARSAKIVSQNLAGFAGQITLVAISEHAVTGWSGPEPHYVVTANAPNSAAMLEAIESQLA